MCMVIANLDNTLLLVTYNKLIVLILYRLLLIYPISTITPL